MSEAVRIARETTLGPIEVQHYIHGGLDGETIKVVHNLARAENVTMSQVVERLFSWDPTTGYEVRLEVIESLAALRHDIGHDKRGVKP